MGRNITHMEGCGCPECDFKNSPTRYTPPEEVELNYPGKISYVVNQGIECLVSRFLESSGLRPEEIQICYGCLPGAPHIFKVWVEKK